MKIISPVSKSIHAHRSPSPCAALLLAATFLSAAAPNRAADFSENIVTLRREITPSSNLDVKMRIDAQHDIALRLEPSAEPLGQQLDTHQMWKLEQIRAEAPERFRLLQKLFPRQLAEYLLREGTGRTSGANDASRDDATQVAMRIAERYLAEPLPAGFSEEQSRARREFVTSAAAKLPPGNTALRAVLESCARHPDSDFGTVEKTNAFLALKKQYCPYASVPMTIAGDTLLIGGKVITERLRADASVAARTPEQYAREKYAAITRELADWRAGQISGDAYAGSIKSFLNDPRLARFSPEEIHRAYSRIFGRELKTDIAADRLSAKEGRPVTYAEMAAGSR